MTSAAASGSGSPASEDPSLHLTAVTGPCGTVAKTVAVRPVSTAGGRNSAWTGLPAIFPSIINEPPGARIRQPCESGYRNPPLPTNDSPATSSGNLSKIGKESVSVVFGPAVAGQALLRQEPRLVGHFRRAMDPIAEIDVRQPHLPRLLDMIENHEGAEAAPDLPRIVEAVDHRQAIAENVGQRRCNQGTLA